MADKTGIAWTDATWNPITGCTKVSQGCKHCYAEREWARLSANHKATNYFGRTFTDVACHEDRLDQPLLWGKPRMIFVNSMSDLFHEDIPDEFIDKVFAIMGLSYVLDKDHIFHILTKRPERMLRYMRNPETIWRVTRAMKAFGPSLPGENSPPRWPLPNVWLGVSVENQETADERIPLLLQAPAAVHWISAGPLLGPIDFEEVPVGMYGPLRFYSQSTMHKLPRLDWVVVEGESGPQARPMHPDWVEFIQKQCEQAHVPFFFKQWGEWLPIHQMTPEFMQSLYVSNRKAKPNENQVEIDEVFGQRCTVPHMVLNHDGSCLSLTDPMAFHKDSRGVSIFRVGTRKAGCLLNGKEWREYPVTGEL